RDFGDAAFIYESMGRIDDALEVFEDRRRRVLAAGAGNTALNFRIFDAFRASIEQKREEATAIFTALGDFPDPEGIFYMARAMAHVGEIQTALRGMSLAIE